MGLCQSRVRRNCPCLNRHTEYYTEYDMKYNTEYETEMKKRWHQKPKIEKPVDVVFHDMVPVENVEEFPKTKTKTNIRPHSLPSLRKQIFINIESSPRNMTPNTEEEWFTPRDATTTYCRVRRDSNENTFTFMVDEEHIKDIYVNYERVRSFSL